MGFCSVLSAKKNRHLDFASTDGLQIKYRHLD
jgi:hypothetical protein